RFLRNIKVEKLVLAYSKPSQNSRLNWHRRDARADAIEVNLNRFDRLLFLLLFLLFRLLLAALRVRGLLLVFLFILLFVRRFFLVALGFERRSLVSLQRHGDNAVGRVIVVPLVKLPGAWIKVARRDKKQVFPAGVEHGVVIVVKTAGNLRDFFGV